MFKWLIVVFMLSLNVFPWHMHKLGQNHFMQSIHSTPKESIHFVISWVLKRNDPFKSKIVWGQPHKEYWAPPRFISGPFPSEYSTNLKVYAFFWSWVYITRAPTLPLYMTLTSEESHLQRVHHCRAVILKILAKPLLLPLSNKWLFIKECVAVSVNICTWSHSVQTDLPKDLL